MFSKKLTELRKSHKMSQQNLAQNLGLKQNTIASYETNNSSPALPILIKIADIFNVSIDYLVDRDTSLNIDYASYRLLTDKEKHQIENVVNTMIHNFKEQP